MRDEQLTPQLLQLWEANYRVYGARKLWKAARRAGHDVGHDVGREQVARLMRAAARGRPLSSLPLRRLAHRL